MSYRTIRRMITKILEFIPFILLKNHLVHNIKSIQMDQDNRKCIKKERHYLYSVVILDINSLINIFVTI